MWLVERRKIIVLHVQHITLKSPLLYWFFRPLVCLVQDSISRKLIYLYKIWLKFFFSQIHLRPVTWVSPRSFRVTNPFAEACKQKTKTRHDYEHETYRGGAVGGSTPSETGKKSRSSDYCFVWSSTELYRRVTGAESFKEVQVATMLIY